MGMAKMAVSVLTNSVRKKKKSLISNHSQLIYHTQAAKYGCAESVSF